MEIGWIGTGRMGYAMALRLLQAGYSMKIWNRTRTKAEPLAQHGGVVVDRKQELSSQEVIFTMLATGRDLKEVLFGEEGVAISTRAPRTGAAPIIIDCSTIGADDSAEVARMLEERGWQFLSAPVSGNPKCVVAGILSSIVSGPRAAFGRAETLMLAYASGGVVYAGEGQLARTCKIAHNMFLATMIENLMEVTLLAQKAGIPRHAFLQFINSSVAGSVFTRYKANALVNLDFTTTFTIDLLRKDVDLGLAAARQLNVAMPTTATVREVIQSHFGVATRQPDPNAYLAQDFTALIETLAMDSGMRLQSERAVTTSGLETSAIPLRQQVEPPV